jgi:hypothetical protein
MTMNKPTGWTDARVCDACAHPSEILENRHEHPPSRPFPVAAEIGTADYKRFPSIPQSASLSTFTCCFCGDAALTLLEYTNPQ